MSVDARNPMSERRLVQWADTRNCIDGALAMLENSTDYIPKLGGQTPDEYRAYVARAPFFEATQRTQQGLTGLVFDKPAEISLPAAVEFLADDCDLAGTDLEAFARKLVGDALATSWGVIVVAHNGDPANPGTRARPSGRPYLQYYPAESILDWRFGTITGPTGVTRGLTSLRLHEIVHEQAGEFGSEAVEQIRVLDLEAGFDFRERIFRKVEVGTGGNKRTEWAVVAEARPLKNGARLNYVPAALVDVGGKGEPITAPLAAIAGLNVSHWRTTADIEHAAHFCGLPTPYITGVSAPSVRAGDVRDAIDGTITGFENLRRRDPIATGPSVTLGSPKAILLENPAAKVGYLEFAGSGITPLRELRTDKEGAMAVLGARIIAPEKRAAESGEALTIRRASENAPLVGVALAVSEALTLACIYAADWQGVENAVDATSVRLNTVFVDETLDGNTLSSLVAAWQAGAMSLQSLLFNLKRGNRLPDDVTPEDEADRIAEEGPALGTIGLNPDDPNNPNPDPNADNPPPTQQPQA